MRRSTHRMPKADTSPFSLTDSSSMPATAFSSSARSPAISRRVPVDSGRAVVGEVREDLVRVAFQAGGEADSSALVLAAGGEQIVDSHKDRAVGHAGLSVTARPPASYRTVICRVSDERAPRQVGGEERERIVARG